MDYSKVKTELLIAIRGTRSTSELSGAMGYTFDQVKRWETGKKHLRWDEFSKYCLVLGVPIFEAVSRASLVDASEMKPEEIGLYFVRHLRKRYPTYSIDELAAQLNCHVSVLKRYLSGENFPDLEFVFALLNLTGFWLGSFLLLLLPAGTGHSLRQIFALEDRLFHSPSRTPLAIAIESSLAMEGYLALPAHDDAFLARLVGCKIDEVREVLCHSLGTRTVVQEKNGKYRPIIEVENCNPSQKNEFLKSLRFWSHRAELGLEGESAIIRNPELRRFGGFMVSAVSKEAVDKINDVLKRAADEIANIHFTDKGPFQDVRISVWHSYNAADVPDRFLEGPKPPDL